MSSSGFAFAPGIMPGAPYDLAGAEGFEPPSSVLETDSLTVELTPLKAVNSVQWTVASSWCGCKLNRAPGHSKLFTVYCSLTTVVTSFPCAPGACGSGDRTF